MPSLVALVTTISGVIVTPLSIACEREQGTFDQFLISPLIPGMIMVGKTVLAVLIAITQGAMILLAAAICYRVTSRVPSSCSHLGSFFCGTSVSSIGLLISSFCETQQQAFLGFFTFMMPAVILSGIVTMCNLDTNPL